MQRILDRTNLFRALQQVTRNQGAPGLDGMTVEQLPDYLKQTWRDTRNKLLNNDYRPQPMVIPPFLTGVTSRTYAAINGGLPPLALCGRL